MSDDKKTDPKEIRLPTGGPPCRECSFIATVFDGLCIDCAVAAYSQKSPAARYQAAYDQLRHIRLDMGRVRHRLLSIEGVRTTHPAFVGQLKAATEEIQDAEAKAEDLLAEMKKGGAI